jgi:hypothetical protein
MALRQSGISWHFLASTHMRSIRIGTLILTIAGLVDAQNRRLLTEYDLSSIQDLISSGMEAAEANAFFDTVCGGGSTNVEDTDDSPYVLIDGAINVLTNVTMPWDEYMEGPGKDGDPDFYHANYPWSTVRGTCQVVLQSAWVTNRDVVYGAWTDNTDSLKSKEMSVGIYLLTPKSTIATASTMPLLSEDVQVEHLSGVTKDMFESARQPDANALANSMDWNPEDHFRRHTRHIPVDKCTQTRFAAVSATRTIIGVASFELVRYYFALREYDEDEEEWKTLNAGKSSKWVDIWKIRVGTLEFLGTRNRSEEWKIVYSPEVYWRVEGPAMLTPGGTMNLQLQSRELPREECNLG